MAADRDLFVVGIGASAGGIEALQEMLRPMPADTGLAFVVVAHLAPEKTSYLHEVIGRFTSMPVMQAQDGMEVAPNHVYVIPSAARLTLRQGRLRLHPSGPGERTAALVDVFFSSLAEDRGDHAIGIVLSGAGSDGTLGVKVLKERDGLTIAQGSGDHDGPRYQSMPSSAIASGLVDLVVPAREIAGRVVAYARAWGRTAHLARSLDSRALDETVVAARRQICALLREQVGHDFSRYKDKTFLRRVQRRMQVVQLEQIADYVERLRRDPAEAGRLFRDLLIGVTSFFRDPDAFAALTELVIPKLFEDRAGGGAVRVWVPGCSTGEEAYSIAMLLREWIGRHHLAIKVQVFGTDIDEAALGVARAGRYAAATVAGLEEERLQRFFTHDNGTYLVAKEVREMCVFSAHSLVRDPPFSRIDLISCRNLLIYLDAGLQAQVIPVFHYALRPGGFLLLGISENLTLHPDLFTTLDKKHRVFVRRDHVASPVHFPLLLPGPRQLAHGIAGRQEAAGAGLALRRAVDARVLERFAPPHVVVSKDGEVVYYSSRTGRYLEAPAGVPNRQLLAMARKGLRLHLRGALQEAMETRRPVSRDDIAVEIDDRVQLIRLLVEPIGDQGSNPLFLVLFFDLGPPLAAGGAGLRARARLGGGKADAQLESDLRDTRERLQSTIEEYETTLEELKAANEELVSMNEELQSTNEELETSKEEIQSINEELQTVNQELRSKVDELGTANADLGNLFASTQIALIFLDRDLIIRSFTPAVAGIFSLIESDRGRPITDIATNLSHGALAEDARAVIETSQPCERRVERRDGSVHYLMRILPYRAADSRVSGAVVTFVDITTLVESERQRLMMQELNHRVRNMLAVVGAIATQTLARAASPKDFETSFMGRIDALSRSYGILARERWVAVDLEQLLAEVLEPHMLDNAGRLEFGGPPVLVRPKAALALGMIAEELATNAIKHGALSVPGGRASASWSWERRHGRSALAVRWREAGGPPVRPPEAKGFSSELIEREVKHDLAGSLVTEFLPEGLSVSFTIPSNPKLLVEPAEGQGLPHAV
jgi:two-component system CheB/CheR fusion protein